VLSTDPRDCRFYFDTAWGAPRMTLQTTTKVYPDANTARNAMIKTGEAGGNVDGEPGLAPGVDGVVFQTSFYPPDGAKDWACAFAKGDIVVTVNTDQTQSSFYALSIAKLIAPRIH